MDNPGDSLEPRTSRPDGVSQRTTERVQRLEQEREQLRARVADLEQTIVGMAGELVQARAQLRSLAEDL